MVCIVGLPAQMFFASVVASCGFLADSETAVIGSMLVSPVGEIVLGIATGNEHNKERIARRLASLLIPIVVGFVAGFVAPSDSLPLKSAALRARTSDLIGIGPWLIGALVAFSGGAAINIAETRNLKKVRAEDTAAVDMASAIGIGIATALLPPLVGAGVVWGRLTKKYLGLLDEEHPSYRHSVYEFTVFDGVKGVGLTIVNILAIIIGFFILRHLGSLTEACATSPDEMPIY